MEDSWEERADIIIRLCDDIYGFKPTEKELDKQWEDSDNYSEEEIASFINDERANG